MVLETREMIVVSPGYTALPRNDDHGSHLRGVCGSANLRVDNRHVCIGGSVPHAARYRLCRPRPRRRHPTPGRQQSDPIPHPGGRCAGGPPDPRSRTEQEVTVRPDGHISTTVVKDELAYGRTVQDLSAALVRDYSTELRDPRLTVVVRSFAPTRIYVGGEVTNPGEFITVGPTLTLSQAIARAGGLKTMSGDKDKIFVIRHGPNDVPQLFSTRYQDVMWGKDTTSDVRLAPFDVVFVPRSSISKVYRFVNSYLLQFVPVSWGFSYLVGGNGGGTSVVQSPTTNSCQPSSFLTSHCPRSTNSPAMLGGATGISPVTP